MGSTARLRSLAGLCTYLGNMPRQEVMERIKAGRLPKPLWGLGPDDPAARWDLRAVDRSIDAASGLPASVEGASLALDRAYGFR